MSAITIDNELVHYEVLGRGRPVILVHGWLSSWRYWIPTMQQLSMKYRTYALDLWGYGDSSKDVKERFTLDAQVKLLSDFMESLGISKAALVGHSLGAAVVIRYALQSPDRVARMMAISPPILDTGEASPAEVAETTETEPEKKMLSSDADTQPVFAQDAMADTQPVLAQDTQTIHAQEVPAESTESVDGKQSTYPRIVSDGRKLTAEIAFEPGDVIPQLNEDILAPLLDATQTQEVAAQRPNLLKARLAGDVRQLLERYLDKGVTDYDKLVAETVKTAPDALSVSANTFADVDLRHDIRRLKSPIFSLHGEQDDFLPPPGEDLSNYMVYGKDNIRVEIWPGMSHFPMLVDPPAFQRLVMDFLETRQLGDIQFDSIVEERWIRKVR